MIPNMFCGSGHCTVAVDNASGQTAHAMGFLKAKSFIDKLSDCDTSGKTGPQDVSIQTARTIKQNDCWPLRVLPSGIKVPEADSQADRNSSSSHISRAYEQPLLTVHDAKWDCMHMLAAARMQSGHACTCSGLLG